MQASLQLVDARGRRHLTDAGRTRFATAVVHLRKPADHTLVLSLAHTGARVSEVLALQGTEGNLDASGLRIWTLKRCVEHWREVPIAPEHARDLKLVHRLREALPRPAREPLWKLSRATVHRKGIAVMATAGIAGPQACPKGLLHGFGIAAVTAGLPLPMMAAVAWHTDMATTAIYTTAVGVEARAFLARIWGDSRQSDLALPPTALTS